MEITGDTHTGTGVKTYTFPIPFIEVPKVVYSAQCFDISSQTYIAYVGNILRTGFKFIVKGHDNTTRSEGVHYTATGRWK